MKVKIKYLDPTTIQISEGVDIVKKCLSYTSEIWIQTKFRRQRKEIIKDFVWGRKEKYTHAGFIPRIKSYCQKRDIAFEMEGEFEKLIPFSFNPYLPNIEIRDYQLNAIQTILKEQRGLIQAATRSGKSIIAIGMASCFKGISILYLAPSIDIVNEIHAKFIECGFNACKLGDGNKEITTDIVVSTVQTYVKLDLIELSDRFQIIMADEIHLMSGKDSSLEKILSACQATIRIGFTATIPKNTERVMLLEGLLGEQLMELSIKDGIEKHKVLAKPKIEILSVPTSKRIKQYNTYKQLYKYGIVENEIRNKIIANYTKEIVDKDKTVLIFCNNIEHIRLISQCLNELKVKHNIVMGSVSGDDRDITKKALNDREVRCVISSVVWTEGVTLPGLSTVIWASGMRSEERVLQSLGRGLGKTKDKDYVVFVDFLDPYPYLAIHTVARLSIYKKLGWL